jgi:hypothetical protein
MLKNSVLFFIYCHIKIPYMDTPQYLLRIINQVFDIEKKSSQNTSILRHTERIKNTFSEMDYNIHNPQGETYNETRTDCEASIAGSKLTNLVITDVIKPIVHHQGVIIQKGVVIVESQ